MSRTYKDTFNNYSPSRSVHAIRGQDHLGSGGSNSYGRSSEATLSIAFLSARKPYDIKDKEKKIFHELRDRGYTNALNLAGAMALDLAARQGLDRSQQSTWLTRAGEAWQEAVDIQTHTPPDAPAAYRAATGLATLPGRIAVVHDRKLPTLDQTEESYRSIHKVAMGAIKLRDTAITEGNKNTQWYAALILGELTVLLLHDRFVLQEVQNEEIVALPALLSEARRPEPLLGSPYLEGWNLSVLTRTNGGEPKISHKVRARPSKFSDKPGFVAPEGVSTVYVQNDLIVTPKEQMYEKMPLKAAILECDKELDGTYTDTTLYTLQDRTDYMLEAIG